MITLKTLLDQLQDICRCMVRNDYDTTRFISRIDILRQNTYFLHPFHPTSLVFNY